MPEPPIETGAGEVAPRPRKTGEQWFDLIVAISAIFISAISLFVAIEHGRTERDLVAASSWPFLREVRSNDRGPEKTIAIGVSNGGVGPAKIVSFAVFYKGAPMSSAVDLLRHCCGLSADPAAARRQLPQGIALSVVDQTVLRAGEDDVAMEVRRESVDPAVAASFGQALADITFKACYCSILDECWISSLQDIRVVPVRSCPAPAVAFVPNGN